MRCAWLLIVALSGSARHVHAQEMIAADAAGNMLRMVMGLGVVILLVFALAWLARRASVMKFLNRGGEGPIRMLGQLSLGTRERLLLVEVEGQKILLGVVPGRITRLDGIATGESGDFERHLKTAQSGARP
ncbi:flagellar biosynthetic protein FliO [Kineobactrum sediminis]|uniref:Flagellar protein n=1 Tax=Kineobactrum sediminis TaxID=1905677 RepID=A0A2N5Y6F8_9GAMM|nr:flagellar biosynthetic protein FliO [Kineobactrum sediminis]PLW83967.1 flagellar biosynthetic protein FliO [Kineobactrum sediminis]